MIVLTVAQKKYEIVVLLPNSELTNGNDKRDASIQKIMVDGLFKLPITLLLVVRNLMCGYSFP